jgi:hypothetical protein
VQITRNNPSICTRFYYIPLLESEKVAHPLPAFHPTELFLTLASYEFTSGKFRRKLAVQGSSLNGGVAIRARAYFEEATSSTATEITKVVNVQAPQLREDATWQLSGNRHFIALLIDAPTAANPKDEAPSASPRVTIGVDSHARLPDPPLDQPRPLGYPSDDRMAAPTGHPNSIRIPADGGVNDSPLSAIEPQQPAELQNPPLSVHPRTIIRESDRAILLIGLILLISSPFLITIIRRGNRQTQAAGHRVNESGTYASGAWAMPDQSGERASYDATEREFNLVFSDQTRAEKEQIITNIQQTHGGSRAENMRWAINQWRRDNVRR